MSKIKLIKLAYKNITETLRSYGQVLEKRNRKSLFELIGCMAECLYGEGSDKYYLASLDPGSGKTEAVVSFVNAWKKLGFDPKTGIIIAVSSLDQLRSIIKRATLDKEDFACITSDDDLNMSGVGLVNATKAPIIFTSHKMIRTRTGGKPWSSTKDFYFNGQVRQLKIWDESLVFSEPLTIPLDRITSLAVDMETPNRAFANRLKAFVDHTAKAQEAGASEIAIPKDIVATAKGLLSTQAASGKGAAIRLPRRSKSTLESLARSAGRPLSIKTYGGVHDRVLVGAVEPLPADFAPAIILDASGRTRTTYDQMSNALGNLVRLASVAHDYRNLDIQLHRMDTGKSALVGENAAAIFRLAAKKISAKPSEEWLIIGPKADEAIGLDVESGISDALPLAVSSTASIRFLHWGAHTATNEYNNIKNIIIIGAHMYDAASYDALNIASIGDKGTSLFNFENSSIRKGEFKSNVLQAVLRGNARNVKSGTCGECDLHLLVSKSFTASDVREIFPGATISDCSDYRLKEGRIEFEICKFLSDEMFIRGKFSVSKKDVVSAVGCSANYIPKVINRPALKNMFDKLGIVVGRTNFKRLYTNDMAK